MSKAGVKAEAKPKGGVQKGKAAAKHKLRSLLTQMATANAKAGLYMDWPLRTVYARAAGVQVQPAKLVKELLGQLSDENVVMVVDDEVHYIEAVADVEPNDRQGR